MGSTTSKRIEKSLRRSPDFESACNSVYQECLDLSQHAFSGVRPYQLYDAANRLHRRLSAVHPLVKKWVPSHPTRIQVDRAVGAVIERRDRTGEEETLDLEEFKRFATELFKDAIVSGASAAVLQRVPVGIAGIAVIGVATRCGKNVIGMITGIYSVGVATAIYLSLSG